jgi:hypothetical protein
MRGAWSTLALVAVAVGLGAYIYFVDSERPDTEAKEKVFAVAADAVEELRVVSKGDTSVLRKVDGTWRLVEPLATDADANEVTTFLNSLTTLELNREVDPQATDLAQYGLAAPKADITFTASGGTAGRIRLGDQTPTGTDIYAVRGDEARVFLVSTFAETSLVRSAFDLRDKRVLRFERDQVDGLEITTAAGTASLTRANSEWRLTAPSGARGDYGAIEGLLTRLSTTMMSGIETTDLATLPKYGLDQPAATVVVKAGSATATLVVGTSADGKAFARDLARPMVFTMDAAFATDLQKGAGEYRKKDLFDLRAFNARQLDITRGADAITFQKKPGTGENAADTWTVSGPGGAAAREANTGLMDDLLMKLSNLRAQAFAAVAPAAGTTPVMTVRAQFDENKKEEASIGRGGDEVFAVRPDEAGAMRLESAPVDEALKALDAVLAPPAPPAPAAPPSEAPPEKKP